MEKKEGGETPESKAAKVYELGYLLVPTILEENVSAEVGNLKGMIEQAGGVHISDEHPKQIALAYDMTKVINHKKQLFSNAYFGWMKFEAAPEVAILLKNELDRKEQLIRFLLIKTVRESTLASRRPYGRGDFTKRKPLSSTGEPHVSVPINKEEIDKKIDELATAM